MRVPKTKVPVKDSEDSDSSVYSDLENDEEDTTTDSENDEFAGSSSDMSQEEDEVNKMTVNVNKKKKNTGKALSKDIISAEKRTSIKTTNTSKNKDKKKRATIKTADLTNNNHEENINNTEITETSNTEIAGTSNTEIAGTINDKVENANIPVAPVFAPVIDEYEIDTSDEEDIRNTIGNVPLKWYDDLPHIGYDVDGKKIMKPATGDEIDQFLRRIDDPTFWRTVKNKMTGENVVLTDEDLDLIHRLQSGRYPTPDVKCEPFEDFFTYKQMEHPVTNQPPHKRSFIPSKIEKEKVSKLVHAIKMGWIKPRVPKPEENQFYMIWDKDVEQSKRLQHYIPAPKRKLPGHEESYNPPPEYLFTKEEEEKWRAEEPEDRKLDFIPQKFSCLRHVPSYSQFIDEAFQRCLDLYLCPRKIKMRVNVDPNDLIPQLPKPKDLQPFPSVLAIVYVGHTKLVRCISVEPSGQFLVSGSDDETLKIWEVTTGRCMRTINLGGQVKHVAWCPTEALSLVLACVEEKVYIINTKLGDKVVISNTESVLSSFPDHPDNTVVKWECGNEEQKAAGVRIIITHPKAVKQAVWHAKGDYFAVLVPNSGYKSIVMHQLSKFQSQIPFQKLKGTVQCICFHPLRPLFFVATHKRIVMINLLKQEGKKVLMDSCKWISSIAVHPQGDNLIAGSYDSKLSWFDLELSVRPYKVLRHHTKAIRQVAFHKRYPLFASTSDDGSVIISHGMVYSDLLQNPLVIPVKVLKGQGVSLDCCFHPQRPWVFCSSNNTIRLFS